MSIHIEVQELYVSTLRKFKEKRNRYMFDNLKNIEFMEFFVKCVYMVIFNITESTKNGHTDLCIASCSFDLVFRFLLDYDFQNTNKDCHCDYFTLQINIFKDNGWKLPF